MDTFQFTTFLLVNSIMYIKKEDDTYFNKNLIIIYKTDAQKYEKSTRYKSL